jgi:lipoprotein-anchoring transpeptidase ErfK/SrfK
MEYSIVSRSINSISIKSILILATLLAGFPSGLHAEPISAPVKTDINSSKPEVSPSPNPPASLTPTQKVVSPSIANPVTTPTTTTTKPETPVADVVNLVLKLQEKRVYVYRGEKLLAKYPVAIGKKDWETPVGEWQVMEKLKNPAWTNFKNGKVVKAGKDNPLGQRWIGFWTDGQDVIGFHGTPDIKSIGKAVSHGCVRMYNRDVKALYPLVKVGTIVTVVEK